MSLWPGPLQLGFASQLLEQEQPWLPRATALCCHCVWFGEEEASTRTSSHLDEELGYFVSFVSWRQGTTKPCPRTRAWFLELRDQD